MKQDARQRLAEIRERFVAKYDAETVADYDACLGLGYLDEELMTAMAQDLLPLVPWIPSPRVLDVGAGTGALSQVLVRLGCQEITALEPSAPMVAALKRKPDLQAVTTKIGFTDAPEDESQFPTASFDLVVSRQVANSLVDPLTAFRNWQIWLKPGGALILIDGFYQRAAWSRGLEVFADELPLAVNQSLALIPYLLETVGFRVEICHMMTATNALPGPRTPRYVVVARRQSEKP